LPSIGPVVQWIE